MKVRFAPSPTGYLHIGGARTALFNWMYARSQKGIFVLRIEDTDLNRSKKEYEEEILDSMKWLGLDWDELYFQSQRFDLYKQHALKLVDEGKAYRQGNAVLLKMPKKEIKIYDLIRGEINFDTGNFIIRDDSNQPVEDKDGSTKLKDEVLLKEDGSPAYSFCCVVDDALMEITTVIRGEDHISNTPRQIVIYEALGFNIPKFAHLPLIMDEGGGRMSKRSGAVAVTDYRKQGFLPEAIINYLMLLGWSPGNNQEIIKVNSAIKNFSIKKINKAAAIFSMDKLKWINGQHIKELKTEVLVELLVPFLNEAGYISHDFDSNAIKNIVDLFKGRLTTLKDFIEWADFMFVDDVAIDEETKKKYCLADCEKPFFLLAEKIQKAEYFDKDLCEKEFRGLVEQLNMKASELVHPIRVALTGRTVGPGLFETMAALGKEKTVKRLIKKYS